MSAPKTTDVLIIGGGLVGWSVAYRLAQQGYGATVVDSDEAGGATQAGAGIICPAASIDAPLAFFALARPAVAYYPELIESLAADEAGETGYQTVGALFVAASDREFERLPDTLEQMRTLRDTGLGNAGELTLTSTADAQRKFPALGSIPGAIHIEKAARVNGRLLKAALQAASTRRGAKALPGTASLRRRNGNVEVLIDGEPAISEAVVIAGGAWTPNVSEPIGITVGVYPQRGQIMHLDMPDQDTSDWPIILGHHSHYILTFPPNRVVCGATREHDSGFDVRLTAGGVYEDLSEAFRLAPGLASGSVAEMRVGLRPLSTDGMPIMGKVHGLENVYVCTGHGPSGLQLGPYSGVVIADLITGLSPKIDMAPYDPMRFQQ